MTQAVESQKELAVAAKSAALQEKLAVQRQLLRELEQQLHESQRTCTQLRAQVHRLDTHQHMPYTELALAVGLFCASPRSV